MAYYLGSHRIFYSDPFDDVRVTYIPTVSRPSYTYYSTPATYYHIDSSPYIPYRTISYEYFI
jgi:hypothetical protein